jgi:hypothetical protein
MKSVAGDVKSAQIPLSGKTTNQELRNRVLFTWFSAWKAALDKFDLAVVI